MSNTKLSPENQARSKKRWRLIVWQVSPAYAPLMARLKLLPAKKNNRTFWRLYPENARDQIIQARNTLVAAGLHGVASLVDAPDKPDRKYRPRPSARSREGFGSILNATPIKSSWRRR